MTEGTVAVFGAGITGLTAAYFLQQQGCAPLVIERDDHVGGLAKTISHNGFRFDLGGHRFLTRDVDLERFVKALLHRRYVVVNRSSHIYLNQRYIKYPLQPLNAFMKVGAAQTLRFLKDYVLQKCVGNHGEPRTLEEWVVRRFGKSLYEVFFKGYSEKVWGLDCNQIDSDWIAQRIQNLNLSKAITSAISKRVGKNYATLTDEFIYPSDGIGSLSDSLYQRLNTGRVKLQADIKRIQHNGGRVTGVEFLQNGFRSFVEPQQIISTIPLPVLIRLLNPAPPADVLNAAQKLKSRDLVLVTLMFNRNHVSRDSWIYFPDKDIPFGRIHEPKNWSAGMSPEGQTAIVAEHFCFRNDDTWSANDAQLIQRTLDSLVKLGFVHRQELLDGVVLRIPNAYPLFEIGYRENCEAVCRYLRRFENLNLAGRTGAFRYYNMDQAMLAGISAVENVTGRKIELAQYGAPLHMQSNLGERNEMCPDYSGLAP